MALVLVVENTVSMTVSTLALPYGTPSPLRGPVVQQQPPKFGVVASGTGSPFTTVDVLWEGGTFTSAVPIAAFDKIGTPDSGTVTTLQGRVVQVDGESPEYWGTVISMYTRDHTGTPGATVALLRLQTGVIREVLASSLSVVTGR